MLKLFRFGGARTVDARHRPRILFLALGQDFPGGWSKTCARSIFCRVRCASFIHRIKNDATIRVLQANWVRSRRYQRRNSVAGHFCVHAGVRDIAAKLARTNMAAFLAEPFDAIVTNAAGCGSTLKEYDQLFPAGTAEHAKAIQFRAKMRDITEFLAELGLVAPLKNLPLRVTYQDSCHLLHGQKISAAPRTLIRAVPGVELVEMALAGSVLRLGRRLQRDGNPRRAGNLGVQNGKCSRHESRCDCHRKPRLYFAVARGRPDSRHWPGSNARSRAAGSRA